MKTVLIVLSSALMLGSCRKATEAVSTTIENQNGPTSGTPAGSSFQTFIIEAGAHFANQNALRPVQITEQHITVRFDSSAIYTTRQSANQYDINKLWGFSDNNSQHHQYSARLGWRWSQGALRLFGYVYNNGVLSTKELGSVAIGAEHRCSIRISTNHYIFTLNGRSDSLLRSAPAPTAQGYQLYPYFGGDETAPHRITIHIRED